MGYVLFRPLIVLLLGLIVYQGVFAGTKKIPSGTFLGIYSGELLTNAEAEQRGK